MAAGEAIQVHEKDARDYDRQVREYEYFAPDVLFGLGYEYLRPGERLLDIGIGTGLASQPFHRMGLRIYGLDGSAAMLDECRKKDFAEDLKCHDLEKRPWPYDDGFFAHAIACGIFQFFGDLRPIFREASRIIKSNGIFAFTVAVPPAEAGKAADRSSSPEFVQIDTPWGVPIFAHSRTSIAAVLRDCGFSPRKRQGIILPGGPSGQNDMVFAVHLGRRT